MASDMKDMKEKIQQDIDPKDIAKVIADLAKLGYKVEKEETKEEKELRVLEEMLTRMNPVNLVVEPTDEELFAWAKNEHPHYMNKWIKEDIEDRIKQLKGKK